MKLLDPILVAVLLLNFVALGASQLRTVIHAVALQGVLLGVTIVVAHSTVTVWVILMAGAVIALKGVVIPRMLFHAIREVAIRREVEPIIGFIASLLLGGMGTALAVLFSKTLPITVLPVQPLSKLSPALFQEKVLELMIFPLAPSNHRPP